MKKRYLILAGILAASMLAAGCGKKNSVAPEQKVEATATPTVTEAAKMRRDMRRQRRENGF